MPEKCFRGRLYYIYVQKIEMSSTGLSGIGW